MARRTIDQAVANLTQVANAGVIGPRYIQGIQGADWKTPTATADTQNRWSTAVAAAAAAGRFLAGVNAVSNEQWRQAAEQKGGPIIGQRIVASIQKYRSKFGPILSAMNSAAANLPPRTSSPSQNIQSRMIPVVRAAVEAAGKQFS